MKLGHDRHLALVPWDSQEAIKTLIMAVSKWVLQTIEEVSKVFGLSFEGLEPATWELFVQLDKREMARWSPGRQGGQSLGEGSQLSVVV